jgi:hypothetical protein
MSCRKDIARNVSRHGKKRYDFEEIPAVDQEKTRYQCEQCGVIIEA